MSKMMDIKFGPDETLFIELQEYMNGIGETALYLSHYELAERTGQSPISWKKFLLDPRVGAFISEEMDLLKRAKVSTMLSTVDTNKNTGQAQLLNTLLNQTKGSDRKEGPVFIYTHVPLNTQERNADNVRTEEYEDIANQNNE